MMSGNRSWIKLVQELNLEDQTGQFHFLLNGEIGFRQNRKTENASNSGNSFFHPTRRRTEDT